MVSLVLINVKVFGQKENDTILNIRKSVEQINKDSGYTIKKLNNEEFLEETTDGGGELTGYFKNKKIYKIFERIGFSNFISVNEYYFLNEQLIFVYEQEIDPQWSDSINTYDWQKQKLVYEGRYYYDNGRLIKSIIKGEKRFKENMNEKKEVFLQKAKRNKAILKK